MIVLLIVLIVFVFFSKFYLWIYVVSYVLGINNKLFCYNILVYHEKAIQWLYIPCGLAKTEKYCNFFDSETRVLMNTNGTSSSK
jgi:hypothetical protein